MGLVYVEGSIGAGKSTYAEEVGKRLNYRVMKEPVNDNPYLEPFYQDPKHYAYAMQIYLLHRRIGLQRLAADESLYSDRWAGAIIDRSVFGDRVFAEEHFRVGNISELDMHAYDIAYESMRLMIFPPTVLVYLDVTPETAYRRIHERDRKVECKITLEYLQALNHGYRKLMKRARDGNYPWSHCLRLLEVPWDPATRTVEEWDAVARNLEQIIAEHEEDGWRAIKSNFVPYIRKL
jgi:deoxyadenosine/deoxycytidine kinase